MSDYKFGNYLCMLRTSLCLSQYQIGKLVGVSDKAVSKWENGSAKPRLETMRQLASIFGVSVEQLLSGGEKSDPSVQASKELKKIFWKKIDDALHQKYGPYPPVECIGRIEAEKTAVTSDDFIHSLNWLSLIGEEGRKNHFTPFVRGTIGSWFIAWLLNCSNVNPLPPHYYCPHCQRTEFIYEAADGWDLPEKICCGDKMKRDGHKIPYEGVARYASRGSNVELDIPKNFLEKAYDLIKNYYAGKMHVVPTIIVEEEANFQEIDDVHKLWPMTYVLLPVNQKYPELEKDGFWHVSAMDIRKDKNVIRIIVDSGFINELWEAREKTHSVPAIEDIVSERVLRNTMQWYKRSRPDIVDCCTNVPMVFTTILKVQGFQAGTNVWEDNGEVLCRENAVPFTEIPAHREDIWQDIVAQLRTDWSGGTGFALRVMTDVRRGRYASIKRGMDADTERVLSEMNLPEWYIPFLKKVFYIFPKAHDIEIALIILEAEWFVEEYGISFQALKEFEEKNIEGYLWKTSHSKKR